jgi:serine/threonine protein kinase
MSSTNWIAISNSSFPWERDALDFIRDQFPSHEPYRAWSNFEFIAEDGSICEVDLLVFSPQGCFLIEIKSRPGRLHGDAGTWIWETPGKPTATTDNPLLLANAKSKKLRSLLNRQSVAKKRGAVPWIEPLVFCSAKDLQCDLVDNAASRVCLRDTPTRDGIMAAIQRRACPGLPTNAKGTCDRPTAKIMAQALEQAGVRPSHRTRRVSDYVLGQLIDEGPGYQDWNATHTSLENTNRRVRIYNMASGASEEERETIDRAAKREAELLEVLQHPGILRREHFTQSELGPALIFEHNAQAMRLDHFLSERAERLGLAERIELMRKIANVIRFAHGKRIVHRMLSPQSVLIYEENGQLQVKIFNWQAGFREGTSTTIVSRPVTATQHVDRLVNDASTAYMAPEKIAQPESGGEHLDVFSLGAVAYYIFTGEPPASGGLELSNRLRETKGLQISAVLGGTSESLQEVVQWSTHPDVGTRLDSAEDFLEMLDHVEEEFTTPDADNFVEDPSRAGKDDLLPGNYRVLRALGQGSCSLVFLVEKDGQEYVLKVASSPDHNARLEKEADNLVRLRHNHIVEQCGTLQLGEHFAFLMKPVFANRKERKIETLRERLRSDGRLQIDLLKRFGEDLLEVVRFLEEEAGINHRDIKPDNIAIGQIRRGSRLHLVLFDFSLSDVPVENLRAGTKGYLDPLLANRKNKRWDLHAERYAAAATLYELAAGPGNLPVWGDGTSDPSHLSCEATIDGDLFEPALRDSLAVFFGQAFRRDPVQRFDNAEQMVTAWRQCFEAIETTSSLTEEEETEGLHERLNAAKLDTQIPELGLGTRATNALDAQNILTVADLLKASLYSLNRLRGVGQRTRRQINQTFQELRRRLGDPMSAEALTDLEQEPTGGLPDIAPEDIASLSADRLVDRILRAGSREGDSTSNARAALLGLATKQVQLWPSQSEMALQLNTPRRTVSQIVEKLRNRWAKDQALTRLRNDFEQILNAAGGVMTGDDVATAILTARGSIQDEPLRTSLGRAAARACVEAEQIREEPRFAIFRERGRVLIATTPELAGYAVRLGDEADRLADQDPLVPPARTLERLRAIDAPESANALPDTRLIHLAAAASQQAALSSRQELYPRGMEAERALKLAQAAIYGMPRISPEQIQSRVASRYSEAAAVSGRPQLDQLLRQAGLDLKWNADLERGGGYESPQSILLSKTSGSEARVRLMTRDDGVVGPVTPEVADARQLEDRFKRAADEGAFLVLMADTKDYQRAIDEITHRFPVRLLDMEGLLIEKLQKVAADSNVNWEKVVATDNQVGARDWSFLLLLVGRAIGQLEPELTAAKETLLLTYPGLLARYDQLDLLGRLRQMISRGEGPHGLWLLLPGSQPMIDGQAVALGAASQATKIPRSWIRNLHRSGQPGKEGMGSIA